MNHNDVINYIKTWATELKAIAHIDSSNVKEKRFFYNIDEFKEVADNIPGYDVYAVVMEDRHRGRLAGNNNNIRDLPAYSFFIVKRVKKGDYPNEEVVFQECKSLIFKFRALLRKHTQEEANNIARYVDDGSFNYRRIGPELDVWHGCQISFAISDNVNDVILYDSDDYTNQL